MGVKQERYVQYISFSPVWKAKRAERLKLDGNQCKKCGSTESLHVHHRTYARFGGRELITDLVTLCEKCHSEVHNLNKMHAGSLERVTARFLGEEVRKAKNKPRKRTPRTKKPRLPRWTDNSDPTWIKTSSQRTPDEVRKQRNGLLASTYALSRRPARRPENKLRGKRSCLCSLYPVFSRE